MKTSIVITIFFVVASQLSGVAAIKLSDRPQEGELQQTCSAVRDGYELLNRLIDDRWLSKTIFAEVSEAKREWPSYVTDDPRYNTEPPMRPQITKFKLSIAFGKENINSPFGADHQWNEIVNYNAWHGPPLSAYQGLTEFYFDPFTLDGEIAFQIDDAKRERNRFVKVMVVPFGWSRQIADALIWRRENKILFEKVELALEEVNILRQHASSSSPIIKKMAASLLIKHKAATAEDFKVWLKAEVTLIDVAVLVQLILLQQAHPVAALDASWLVSEGEFMWGGALIASTLLFTRDQASVNNMKTWQYKRRQANTSHTTEMAKLIEAVQAQVSYHQIKQIGDEITKQKKPQKFPFFSAGHLIFSASYIVDPSLFSSD